MASAQHPGGSNNMSDGYDDATDLEDSDEPEVEEDPYVDRDKYDNWIPPIYLKAQNVLEDDKNAHLPLAKFCICCWCVGAAAVKFSHPIFDGGLCKKCRGRLLRTMFAKVRNKLVYCTICGTRSSASINCSSTQCTKNYCINCLTIWTEDGERWTDLLKSKSDAIDDWKCFLCLVKGSAGRKSKRRGKNILKAHSNWPQKVLGFHEHISANIPRALKWKREPLRVLSLFDGIGTGLLALHKVGIKVEVYYASEVFSPAAIVSRARLGGTGILQHVGSVGEITRSVLESMLPIHLLIGGSPCNDFSAINRFPKNFYDPNGYCLFFYDFVRIRNLLMDLNRSTQQHLFWLFENVTSMPKTYRQIISKNLGCQPAILDARDFSPQLRRRYFWGNLPGLLTLPEVEMNDQEGGRKINLSQALIPNLGRRAAQFHVRTLTTNTNSLLQGRTENCRSKKDRKKLFPVRVGDGPKKNSSGEEEEDDEGNGDVLWLQEIEQVFGFPQHYTDVGNISRTDRQKLLGHAWSVPVIAHIFTPLREYTDHEDPVLFE